VQRLLTRSDFYPYQEHTARVAEAEPMSMLHLDVGLGKTPVTLAAMDSRFSALQLTAVLVVAPARVCQTVWKQEAKKWDFSRWLKFSDMHGPDASKRLRALMTPANVYLINYENLPWLRDELLGRYVSRGKYPPFNMLVLDEVDKMRSTRVKRGINRGQALLELLLYFPYRMGLTGTPAGEGWLDLFGQYLCIDSGKRLGRAYSVYQKQYFALDGYGSRRWVMREGATAAITKRIGDITVALSGDDYLKLPPYVFSDHWVDLPPAQRKQYNKIERKMMVELESGREVEVFNAASLTNRCLQFASGAIFLVPGEPAFEAIHKLKLDALHDIIGELSGEPVLVAYQFRHEAERILKDRRFKGFVWFSSKLGEREANQLLDDWVAGRVPGIIGHPASVGHGIDRLQHGGRTVVWYGAPWSYRMYHQTNGRLRRNGQTKPVLVPRILVRGTVDEAVCLALERKEGDETSVRQALMDYWKTKQLRHSGDCE